MSVVERAGFARRSEVEWAGFMMRSEVVRTGFAMRSEVEWAGFMMRSEVVRTGFAMRSEVEKAEFPKAELVNEAILHRSMNRKTVQANKQPSPTPVKSSELVFYERTEKIRCVGKEGDVGWGGGGGGGGG